MPGAFNFAYGDAGASAQISGAKSHIFQPPRTPSVSASSSLYLTLSANTSARSPDSHHAANEGRKRSRVEYDARANDECPGSPIPLANTKYVLAGGLDTPGVTASKAEDVAESDYFSDVGYRRELSDDFKLQGLSGEESRYQSFAPPEFDEEPRRSRASSNQFTGKGAPWNRSALQVVGEVVGKVWEFCKTSAFRGFQAGGGKGYTIGGAIDPIFPSIEEDTFWETEKVGPISGVVNRGSTPIPGQFPKEDVISVDRATPEYTPPRAGKRRQLASDGDELGKNWVVIPPTDAFTPLKPHPRASARYCMQTASSASRRSGIGRPASRAGGTTGIGPRRPTLQSRVSHAGSPALQSRASASYASPRSPGEKIPRANLVADTKITNSDSPAAKEAQRWAALKRKEEREADESIRRLDAQLMAMIKEGKEALGTKFEVEIEDDYVGNNKKWAF